MGSAEIVPSPDLRSSVGQACSHHTFTEIPPSSKGKSAGYGRGLTLSVRLHILDTTVKYIHYHLMSTICCFHRFWKRTFEEVCQDPTPSKQQNQASAENSLLREPYKNINCEDIWDYYT